MSGEKNVTINKMKKQKERRRFYKCQLNHAKALGRFTRSQSSSLLTKLRVSGVQPKVSLNIKINTFNKEKEKE